MEELRKGLVVEVARLRAERAELVEALRDVVDANSDVRRIGKAIVNARALLARIDGEEKT